MTTVAWMPREMALLQAMGIPLWAPQPPEALTPAAVAPVPARPSDARSETPAPPEAPDALPRAASAAPQPAARRPDPPNAAEPATPAARPPVAAAEPLGTRPGGVKHMGWEALRDAVSGCQACGLCRSRLHTVFGVGHPQARWMLVGEAPGEQEDLQGEPFVGKAGQLLDNMLRSVGLTRADAPAEQQVYIANVLKCRPPANRNPEPAEVAQCEPYLKRQVELVAPKLILAMGRFAVQSLLGSQEPIGRLRGKVHQYHGVPLVVTYHPAYLLRNPLDKSRAWEDLCLALEVIETAGAGTGADPDR